MTTTTIDNTQRVLNEVYQERRRQVELAHGGDTHAFDRGNTQNDWVAYINAYSGRASQKVARNEREGQKFRDNMVKVAALAVAAIESYDDGFCADF